ncbi:MAG TPA: peptidoglycan editing factor PgeF [Rhizomicrobium sp.]|nr:peptidoglycan editing factor PgeF [Rhizomicrobium sp.]
MLVLRAKNLSTIAHGFFGRQGGVSTGIFASLNCGPGSGDERQAVAENRRRVMEELGGGKLATLHQIHSPNVVTVTQAWEMGQGPQADAMVTNIPRIALGILTADCAPVLFADAEARIIGAAHAGWKGAISGVIESVLDAMEKLGASRARIAASIGPCISQKNYEVGPEFRARFLDADPANVRFFIPSNTPDHFHFDLEGYTAARLAAAGIGAIEPLCACTYAREADFFSFRRATHRKEGDYGRQISAIMLTP